MLMIHFKGELSDGHVHITAEEFCEHSVHERYEKDLAVLRKLANNPILNQEIRDAVWSAIRCYHDKIMWRNDYIRLLNENRALRKTLEELNEFVRRKRHGTDT